MGAVRCGAPRRRLAAGGAGANRRRTGRGSAPPPHRRWLLRSLPAGRLPGVTPADRVMAVAVADLWPGHRRRRAVIVKPGQGELARRPRHRREVKVVTMSPPPYPGAPRAGPAAGSGHRRLPPDTRHPERQQRHEHNGADDQGDDDRADEDHRPLPSSDPGVASRRRRPIPGACLQPT